MRRAVGWADHGLRELGRDTVARVRQRGRSAVYRALRLTGAAVASYVAAQTLSSNTLPLLAPLTALLVVQVTLAGTLSSGVERVVSVVAGVLLAVSFSAAVGLTWWSLAALVAVSIVIGQLLKLGPNLLEVPISAMLVLGVGVAGTGTAAAGRVAETLVGAVVGVLVNLLFPPAVRTIDAGEAVERFAGRTAGLLDAASQDIVAGPSPEAASRWLDDARRLTRHLPTLDRAVAQAEESRKLNVRALGTPVPGPGLRDGVDALEHTAVAVRSMFRSIQDGIRAAAPGDPDDYAADVRAAFGLLLDDLAAAVRAYGKLVRAQAEDDGLREEAELALTLESLREARARVTELLLSGVRDDPQYWELNVAVLTTVERVLRELDLDDRIRLREQRRRRLEERGGTRMVAERLRASTRHLVEGRGDAPGEGRSRLRP